tara:strand:+ start:2630 stop:2824 length:195 start_codon:yes stop_codon:yes gene_type:complete
MQRIINRKSFRGRQEIVVPGIRRTKRANIFRNNFFRDIAAMKEVWAMIRKGTITAIGESGRQYH